MAHRTIRGLAFGTPEYVLAHGLMRIRQGKSLSAVLLGPYQKLNPRKAYSIAQKLSQPAGARKPSFNRRGQTSLEWLLGIPPPCEDPRSRERKVPHTCYQWY